MYLNHRQDIEDSHPMPDAVLRDDGVDISDCLLSLPLVVVILLVLGAVWKDGDKAGIKSKKK